MGKIILQWSHSVLSCTTSVCHCFFISLCQKTKAGKGHWPQLCLCACTHFGCQHGCEHFFDLCQTTSSWEHPPGNNSWTGKGQGTFPVSSVHVATLSGEEERHDGPPGRDPSLAGAPTGAKSGVITPCNGHRHSLWEDTYHKHWTPTTNTLRAGSSITIPQTAVFLSTLLDVCVLPNSN